MAVSELISVFGVTRYRHESFHPFLTMAPAGEGKPGGEGRAAARAKAKSAAAAKEKSSAMAQSALLALMFLGWYVASFFTDTFNKKVRSQRKSASV